MTDVTMQEAKVRDYMISETVVNEEGEDRSVFALLSLRLSHKGRVTVERFELSLGGTTISPDLKTLSKTLPALAAVASEVLDVIGKGWVEEETAP